jgi:hypothetical protein
MSPSSISSSDDTGDLVPFCLQVVLFLTPLLIFVGIFEVAFWRVGESWPMSRIAAAHQERDTLLIRKQYFGQPNSFKFHRVRSLKPEVICLGTSRSLQIRDIFFAPRKGSFYNGGGMLGTFADIHAYVAAVQVGDLPKSHVVIFCVEPWWIKSGLPPAKVSWGNDAQYADSFFIPEAHITAMRMHLRESGIPWKGMGTVFSPAPHSGYPIIGAAALAKGVGFRHDGSYQYDPATIISFRTNPPFYKDREAPPVIENLLNATDKFTPASSIDEKRVRSMIEDFKTLRGMGVEVLVLLPPWAKPCWDLVEQGRPEHAWWKGYKNDVPSSCHAAGFTCVGPSTPQDHGLEDTTMWDGYHSSEVLMARIINDLAMKTPEGSKIRSLISPDLPRLARFATHPLSLEPGMYKP